MSEFGAFEWTSLWAKIRNLELDAADHLPSTNTKAKEASLRPPLAAGLAVGPIALTLARTQTAGRGRSNNEWISADGALLSSWTARLAKPPQPILSPLIGLALYSALDRTFMGLPLSLKAPNDLYLSTKKVAGVLIENVVSGDAVTCIVGLGMNVLKFPESIPNSTSLAEYADETSLFTLWPRFLEAWFEELKTALIAGQSETLDKSARFALCTALNRNPNLSEPILDIDERGQLQTASGFRHWHSL